MSIMKQYLARVVITVTICALVGLILDRAEIDLGVWYFIVSFVFVGVFAVYPAMKAKRNGLVD